MENYLKKWIFNINCERINMKPLKHRLKRAGVTLREISNEVGVSKTTVSITLNDQLTEKIKLACEKLLLERRQELGDVG